MTITPTDAPTATARTAVEEALSTRCLNIMRSGIKWPLLIQDAASPPLMDGVVTCLLTAMSLLAFLGLRYPATYHLPRIGDASAAANQGGGRRRPDVEASVLIK